MLIAAALLCGIFVVTIFTKPSENISDNQYYKNLSDQCDKSVSKFCCYASLSYMKQYGYVLAQEGKCPQGESPNTMKCITSYQWCQPVIN